MQISTWPLTRFFEAVEDRAQVEVVGFDVPEVALDVLEVLVGGDGAGGVELGGGERGADDVDPVEPGFVVDLRPASARRSGWCR